MTEGQVAFSVAADVAALDACADELAAEELLRGAAHVRQLRTLLQMEAVGRASGMELATVSHAALALGCSEHRAARLLSEAVGLGELAGALEAVECGLLTVEQSVTLVEQLAPVPFAVRRTVWERLRRLLIATGEVLPPARLAERLARWIRAADAEGAAERRRQAEAGRRLDCRRRDDGLGDLFALGFTGPDLQAVLSRVRDRSAPVGPDDDRTADQRRFDAFKDLLLGRDPLPLTDPHDPLEPARPCPRAGGGRAGCGCWPGSPVPCGAELLVHLTIDTGLGTSDEPAELVGHGPIDPDLLVQLLLAAPRLRPVWTGPDGVPIAVGDTATVPARDDPGSVRQALLHLAGLPPPSELHPRHPLDHPSETASGQADLAHATADPGEERPPPGRSTSPPSDLQRPDSLSHSTLPAADGLVLAATAVGTHPTGTPGPYRLPRRLRRLIDVRSPRCEWPGCGAGAVRCDAEHDLAWPAGPTCACNLGPCCRRHHRIKQLGWTKTRHAGGVTWTSPGRGQRWLSPHHHPTPDAVTRPVPPLAAPDPFAELSPYETECELRRQGLWPDDPAASQDAQVEALATEDADRLRELLLRADTTWTLDLDNPYLWQEQPDPVDA